MYSTNYQVVVPRTSNGDRAFCHIFAVLTRVHVWPVDDHLPQLLDVPRRHGHPVGQLLRKHFGKPDLVDVYVRV